MCAESLTKFRRKRGWERGNWCVILITVVKKTTISYGSSSGWSDRKCPLLFALNSGVGKYCTSKHGRSNRHRWCLKRTPKKTLNKRFARLTTLLTRTTPHNAENVQRRSESNEEMWYIHIIQWKRKRSWKLAFRKLHYGICKSAWFIIVTKYFPG